MWPWGHAATGYLCYSLGTRLFGRTPTGSATLAVLFGTQLPDLLDKPLSWVFELFPQGYSVGHSVFVAVPVGLFVLLAAYYSSHTETAVGFVVGYWSHLFGDLVFGLVTNNPLTSERLLWPIATLPSYTSDLSAIERILAYGISFLHFFADEGLVPALVLLAIYFGPVVVATLVWLYDGHPGPGTIRRMLAHSWTTAKGILTP
ncbi:metal-dependent hydrolase [Halocatena halophila]|uniref:metal-dependent hydrolase n=1 Tax=Halocatena halophila TaxID=2814576 RepID=UPI002ED23206